MELWYDQNKMICFYYNVLSPLCPFMHLKLQNMYVDAFSYKLPTIYWNKIHIV